MDAFITRISRKRKSSELSDVSKKNRKKEIASKPEKKTTESDDEIIIEDYSDHASDEMEIEQFSDDSAKIISLINSSYSKTQEKPGCSKMNDNNTPPSPRFKNDTRKTSSCETAYSQLLKRNSSNTQREHFDEAEKVQRRIPKFFPTVKSRHRNTVRERVKKVELKKADDTLKNIHRGNELYLKRRETKRVVSDFREIETTNDHSSFDLLVRCKESWATEEFWIKTCRDWRPSKQLVLSDCNNRTQQLILWGEECFDVVPIRIFDVVLITKCSMRKSTTLKTSGNFYVIGNLLDRNFYDAISLISWHDLPVIKPIKHLQLSCESAEESLLENPIDDYQQLPQTAFDCRLKNVLCFVEEFSSSKEQDRPSIIVLKTRDIQGNCRRLILHTSAGDWTKLLRLHQKSLWEFKQIMLATSVDYGQEEMHTTLSSQADHCDEKLNYRHQLNNCTVIEDKTSLHGFITNSRERRAVVRVSTVHKICLQHNAVLFETRRFSLSLVEQLIDVFLLLRSKCEDDDNFTFYFVVLVDRVTRPVFVKASAEVFLSIWHNSTQHQSMSKSAKEELATKLKRFLTNPNKLVVEKKMDCVQPHTASLSLLDVF